MARTVVEMHGGTIAAQSDGPGMGSEFVITLPLAAGEPTPRATGVQRPKRAVPLRILVVDDNVDGAEMMQTLLELDGDHVTAVHDGAVAIEEALASRPGVALIDLGMPGLDGFEVARRLRDEPSMAGTVLVAVTGGSRLLSKAAETSSHAFSAASSAYREQARQRRGGAWLLATR